MQLIGETQSMSEVHIAALLKLHTNLEMFWDKIIDHALS